MIRRRLGSVAVATLVLFVACTDLLGPLADSDSVRLVVRPSFAHMPANVAGDNPAAQVDNVHIILRNSAGVIVVDQIVEWPLGQDTLRLDLDVTVSGSESFELTIGGRAGEQILFQAGPMTVDLSEGGSSVETNPVLEYAGPGAGIAAIEITDAHGSFLAGSDVGLSVTGTNDDGSAGGDLILVWASLDETAATVGPTGTVAVGHDASRAVRIEARVAFTSIADTIEGPILPSELVVSPGAAALTALGAEQAVTAALLGVDGGAVSGIDVAWDVADASVIGLTASGASAIATALATGETWAIATAAGLADSTLVTVAQTVDRVAVEIEDTTFERIGTTRQAVATALDANDHAVTDAIIDWTTRAPAVATVEADGMITAATPGTAWIVASSGGAADSVRATVRNVDPELTIVGPSADGSFAEGETITFEGAATDLEDGDLSAGIEWSSSATGDIGTGSSVADSLAPGTHTITAAITDSHGAAVSTAFEVVVAANTAPAVSITAPASAITGPYGTAVTLTGSATDAEDGSLSSSIQWSSSADGALGAGASLSADDLSIGTHIITASVADSRGLVASATRTVEVTNNAPTVSISAPADGAAFGEGATITFEGAAADVEDGALSAGIQWSSDEAGTLGAGASVSAALTPGTHVITAAITDSHGAAVSTAIEVVVAANAAPAVSITAPAGAVSVAYGTAVTFTGSAMDAEDGSLSSSIQWSSSADGALGAGASLSADDLSIGSHTITASVTDSRGLEASATRAVEVTNNAPTVSITAPGDGAAFDEGRPITFAGAASDVEDGDISAAIEWTTGGGIELGTGPSIQVSDLALGTHTILASVIDGNGASGSTSVDVTVVQTAYTISGTVHYAGSGLAGVEVELLDGSVGGVLDASDGMVGLTTEPTVTEVDTTPIRTTTTDGAGNYAFAEVPEGVYTVRATGPTGFVPWVQTDAIPVGGDVTLDLQLVKTMTLLSPADASVVSAQPQLQWEPNPEAARHDVMIRHPDNAETVHTATATSSYTVASPLVAGASYGWSVSAFAADGQLLGLTVRERTFTVATPEPSVVISSPGDDTQYLEGTVLSFAASASDGVGGDVSGDIVWTSVVDNESTGIGAGGSFSNTLPVGGHMVIATVVSGGQTAADTVWVSINPNTPPTVWIADPATSPHDVRYGRQLELQVAGTDPDGDVLTYGWSVDDDPTPIVASDTVATLHTRELLLGIHTVRVIATDPGGLADTATLAVNITEPGLNIVSHATGDTLNAVLNHTFSAGLTHVDTVHVPATKWNFGSGGSTPGWAVTRVLAPGTHTITASIANSKSTVTTATINVVVLPPPSLTFGSPEPGETVWVGDSMLTATATDAAGGDISNQIQWHIDGELYGAGDHLFVPDLAAGVDHIVMITVTDPATGFSTSDARTFRVF